MKAIRTVSCDEILNLFFLLFFGTVSLSAIAQQPSPDKEDPFLGRKRPQRSGYGFSHEKTAHHFHLLADRGAIEIQGNEPTDAASQEAICQHLAMIGVKFSQGNFAIPMSIRATVPPGVIRRREDMFYVYRKAGQLRYLRSDSARCFAGVRFNNVGHNKVPFTQRLTLSPS